MPENRLLGGQSVMPGNGFYVDLDGSTCELGVLATKGSLGLMAGASYLLEYRLAGHHRDFIDGFSETDTVVVSILGMRLSRSHAVA